MFPGLLLRSPRVGVVPSGIPSAKTYAGSIPLPALLDVSILQVLGGVDGRHEGVVLVRLQLGDRLGAELLQLADRGLLALDRGVVAQALADLVDRVLRLLGLLRLGGRGRGRGRGRRARRVLVGALGRLL